MRFLIYLITFLLIAPNLLAEHVKVIKRTEFLMGTFASITIYDAKYEKALDNCFDELNRIDETLSLTKEDSLANNINNKELSDEIFSLIEKGIYYSKLTKGAFDITIAPLSNLWKNGFSTEKLPENDEIQQALNLVNYRNVYIDRDNRIVNFEYEDMQFDFGSIAKGYSADVVFNTLQKEGVDEALINIGGNVFVLGNRDVNVGLQDPFSETGEIFASIMLNNKSIVTSGIYERFIEIDGIKYHHILDPKTGYPFINNLASVSIIGRNSLDCDCLSTAIFAMGLKDGLEFVENLYGIEAIFVTKDKKVYITSGVNLKLTNHDYEICDI
ncbi:hypothetical protein AN641_02340 [Candidatus Epulonipiscioides gigas]|nr:hypothetical protein AN641_02340 [Epulopiscium sp. SCG-C07WGA-EpuloA2]